MTNSNITEEFSELLLKVKKLQEQVGELEKKAVAAEEAALAMRARAVAAVSAWLKESVQGFESAYGSHDSLESVVRSLPLS